MNELITLGSVILLDVAFNSYLIYNKHTPNHILNSLIRVIIAILIASIFREVNILIHLVVYFPIYWFCFDYLLNIARKERITYLGVEDQRDFWTIVKREGFRGKISLLDQLQLKTIHEFPAFFFKLILATGSIATILRSYNLN